MTKKAKEKPKKETRIVREFIETRFKEIPPEDKEESEEEAVEKEAEFKKEEESFADFSTSKRSPILLKSEQAPETLERTAESAPPIKTEEKTADLYSSKKYEAEHDNEKYIARETAVSSSLFSTGREREMKDLFSRRDPQAQFRERFAETWQESKNEERQYEPIEKKSREEEKVRLEKRRRMII